MHRNVLREQVGRPVRFLSTIGDKIRLVKFPLETFGGNVYVTLVGK